MEKRNARLIILISACFFSLMGLLTKIASQTIPVPQILFYRFLLGALAIFIPALLGFLKIRIHNMGLHLTRSFFGAIGATTYFLSLQLIPLGNAIVLNQTAPIFATLFESYFYKEKPEKQTVVALIISFAGVLLIFYPELMMLTERGTLNYGYLLGIACGFFGGVALVSLPKLRQTDSSASIFLIFSAVGMCVALVPAITSIAAKNPLRMSSLEWLIIVFLSISGVLAQLFLTYAAKFLRASVSGTLAIFIVIISSVLGMIFLGESLTPTFFIGAAMIVGSSVYLASQTTDMGKPFIEPQ